MRGASRRLAARMGVAAAAASIAFATRARADDAADRKAAAQVLFDHARESVKRGNFAEACPKLAESERLDPGIGTELWLADCYENNGQTASAWVTFKEAAAAAALRHDERERIARDRAARLEDGLSRLAVVVPPEAAAQGLDVRRDGLPVGVSAWGIPVPVDPGVHTIAASAPGHLAWSTTVEIRPKPGTLQVTIPVLADEPSKPPVAGGDATNVGTAAVGPAPDGASAQDSSRGRRIAGLAVAGAGVVGVSIGAYLGLRAKSTYDDAASSGHCVGNACDATGKQDRSTAFGLATGSTVAMIAGGALVAGGAVLYFTAPRGASVAVATLAGARGAALRFTIPW